MSLLKVNEVQNYNGSSLTLTASTVSTSAQLNTGGNVSVTGSINVSDDSTTRSNLGLGSIATQAADSVNIDGGAIDGVTIGGSSAAAGTFTTLTASGLVSAQDGLVVDNDGATVATIDRATSDGLLMEFQKNSTTVGSIGTSSGVLFIQGPGSKGVNLTDGNVYPSNNGGAYDDLLDLGASFAKWDDIYATNDQIQTSDATEKENITSSDLSLNFIKQLNPVSYRFIGKNRTHYGLIAQEIETLLSTIGKNTTEFAGFIKSPVTDNDGKETGEYKYGLRYSEFISPMIKAIQEQQSQIEALTARIEALETA